MYMRHVSCMTQQKNPREAGFFVCCLILLKSGGGGGGNQKSSTESNEFKHLPRFGFVRADSDVSLGFCHYSSLHPYISQLGVL